MDEETFTHRLKTFAHHVATLARAKPGDHFSLSFWDGLVVDVWVQDSFHGPDPNWNHYILSINGSMPENVGNFAAAYEKYTELCVEGLCSARLVEES